jgi:hypothetical protein
MTNMFQFYEIYDFYIFILYPRQCFAVAQDTALLKVYAPKFKNEQIKFKLIEPAI